jgi:hypothetical protein
VPAWGDIFPSGSLAEQIFLWSVASQLVGAILTPEMTALQKDIWTLAGNDPSGALFVPPAPADLADMVVRGIRAQGDATSAAGQSGVAPGDFADLVLNAGEPPGLEQVLEWWRRGFIRWDDTGVQTPSVERAIKTGRIYDYWSDVIQQAADIPITVGEAVNAALRGQAPTADMQTEASYSGIDADRFQILLDSAGRPPSPAELLELYRRKLIPLSGVGPGVVSFQQGIFEGDAKDKWWTEYAALAEYIPPPRTVTTLLKTGSVDGAEAQLLWQQSGLTPTLAAAYAHSATGEKLAGSKALAESTVLTLYETQALSEAEATSYLTALGYDATEVGLLLELADLQRELKAVNSAVTKVGTLYVGHKITRQAANAAVLALGVSPAHAANLLATWDLESSNNVRLLTPAQIVDAWNYGVYDQPTAQAKLEAEGYTPFDAWTLLSIKAETPLPGRPAESDLGPGVNA